MRWPGGGGANTAVVLARTITRPACAWAPEFGDEFWRGHDGRLCPAKGRAALAAATTAGAKSRTTPHQGPGSGARCDQGAERPPTPHAPRPASGRHRAGIGPASGLEKSGSSRALRSAGNGPPALHDQEREVAARAATFSLLIKKLGGRQTYQWRGTLGTRAASSSGSPSWMVLRMGVWAGSMCGGGIQ